MQYFLILFFHWYTKQHSSTPQTLLTRHWYDSVDVAKSFFKPHSGNENLYIHITCIDLDLSWSLSLSLSPSRAILTPTIYLILYYLLLVKIHNSPLSQKPARNQKKIKTHPLERTHQWLLIFYLSAVLRVSFHFSLNNTDTTTRKPRQVFFT